MYELDFVFLVLLFVLIYAKDSAVFSFLVGTMLMEQKKKILLVMVCHNSWYKKNHAALVCGSAFQCLLMHEGSDFVIVVLT